MFRKILVPVDHSEASNRALVTALQLVNQFNSEVELFHVAPKPEMVMDTDSPLYSNILYPTMEQVEEFGEAVFEAALKGLDVGDVTLNKKATLGHPAAEIIEEANKGFDLVVMGSRGHGPIAGAVLGSVAQRVLSHANCPVLIVK